MLIETIDKMRQPHSQEYSLLPQKLFKLQSADHSNTEVKQHWAGKVLGWETSK